MEQRYLVRRNVLAIVGLGLCVYFSWHVVAGERSLLRLQSLEKKIAITETELQATRAGREKLESRVIKLRPGSIDPDLLEERARAMLGYARPDEQIVILPQ